jgi:hypothetical protein
MVTLSPPLFALSDRKLGVLASITLRMIGCTIGADKPFQLPSSLLGMIQSPILALVFFPI